MLYTSVLCISICILPTDGFSRVKTAMSDATSNTQTQFPIRELSARTQVNTVTLRAWERRYGLLKPQRTTKGHRLYSEDDVAIIERILALVARGVPLGKVKPLLQEETPTLIQDDTNESWQTLLGELLTAIDQFSFNKFERLIQETLANYPTPICHERLFEPLFTELAQRDDQQAAFSFSESELLRYAQLRLSAKVAQNKQTLSVTLVAGQPAPLWRLALMALELTDLQVSVNLLNRPFNVAAAIHLAAQRTNDFTVFYQDGIWKDKEQERVSAALLDNPRLFMCGTAAMLTPLNSPGRVFTEVKDCIAGLLQQHER